VKYRKKNEFLFKDDLIFIAEYKKGVLIMLDNIRRNKHLHEKHFSIN